MSEREQLEQAIAALEAQRALLGDAVVDAGVRPIREKLAWLEGAAPTQQRKQATILFTDIAGHTAVVRDLDPEETMEIIDGSLARLAEAVMRHGGQVVRYQGDGFKALFGLPLAGEHDPDNAVLAGLEILATAVHIADELRTTRGIEGFQVRVGIDTGLVLAGGGTEGEDAVTGTPVNLAARLEQAAQPGTVLISQHTYQHVRGVFDLQPLEPIQAKGFDAPVPVYRVLRAKPRSFRTRRRGVEGVETRMVGRDQEMARLQALFNQVVTESVCRVGIIVGEAGLGKSRLLYEFENWGDLQPVNVQLYRGRALLETQRVPYNLVRDLFVFRCGIFDDDPVPVVRDKIVAGFRAVVGEDETAERQAHLVGHLLGYDFADSLYVRPMLGRAVELRNQALFYLAEYFKAVAARSPLVILLEDLHWADDSSLDTLETLAADLQGHPVFFVGAARPALYERRPAWLAGRPYAERIDLSTLTGADSDRLVGEIMSRAADIPDALRDLVVVRAEGNPFYVEELIKMLIDDGVIIPGDEAWTVQAERLAAARVPATLTGVLQARLEGLPAGEREMLQRASVIGRLFWDAAVEYIAGDEPVKAQAGDTFPDLSRREIIYPHEATAFEGTREYVFKHALLRDVTYESVLRRLRRAYHRRAAEWLIEASEERVDEFADLIASHFARAEDREREAEWQARAGRQAAARYATAEAVRAFSRALELTPPEEQAARYDLLNQRRELYHLTGERQGEAADLDALAELAEALNDPYRRAEVAVEQSYYLLATGVYERAREAGERAAALAEEAGATSLRARAQVYVGNALMFLGEYAAARSNLLTAVEAARAVGATRVQLEATRVLGIAAEEQGDLEAAPRFHEEALALAKASGDRVNERRALNSLGVAAQGRGEYDLALVYFEQSLAAARAIGDRVGQNTVLGNMGVRANNLGDYETARTFFEQALALAREVDDQTGVAINLLNLAGVRNHTGDHAGALALYEEAREPTEATGDRPLLGYVLNGIGRVLLDAGRPDEAIGPLREALALRLELDQAHLVAESRAFLAEALAAHEDVEPAMREIEAAQAFLDDHRLEDMEDELRVLLSVYRVLAAASDPRAGEALARAHAALTEAAARLEEPARSLYLQNVGVNRAILEAWAARQNA